ncbi:MAG: 5-(carboxyamino)imidazole ribonucleotide mutase [Candidatus Edwardsbacteria bacterium]
MKKPLVGILMGSETDREVMQETVKLLERLNIEYEMIVSSAHRQPQKTRKFVRQAERKGIKVLICGAGMAAHLAGVVAGETILPVIGVPLSTSSLGGMDSLLSIVQMPAGVPVATMAIGSSGARNAAILAAEILALQDERIRDALKRYRKEWTK